MATYKELALKYGNKHGVDPALILAIMSQESAGKTTAVSNKGASGLMQLMPETAKSLGVTDIFNVEQNVDAGAKYLSEQLQATGGDVAKALANYNAGPARAAKYNYKALPTETRNYVASITGNRLAQAQNALAGKDYVKGSKGVVDIDTTIGASTGTDSSANALGSISPSGTKAIAAAQQAYDQTAKLLGQLPAQPDYAAAAYGSLDVLRGNMTAARTAVEEGQARLEQQAKMSNDQTQMLLNRYNQDPALASSRSSENAQALSDLQAGLLNTIKAKRATAGATLFSDPGAFMSNLLMGNPYARGQKDIEAEISALRNSNIAMTGTINDQRGLLTAATATPASTIMSGMEGQLRLAEMEKDVGLAEAKAPLEISKAQTDGLLAQAQVQRQLSSSALDVLQAETSAANAATAQVNATQDADPLKLEAQRAQWQQIIDTSQRAKVAQDAADAVADPAEKAMMQAEADRLGTLAVLQQRQAEAAGNLPATVGATNVATANAALTQADTAAKLAPLAAQTAEQQAAAAAIAAPVAVGDAIANSQNADLRRKVEAAKLAVDNKMTELSSLDVAEKMKRAGELLPLQNDLAIQEAKLKAADNEYLASQQADAQRVQTKKLAVEEGQLDQAKAASNKLQKAYLSAGGKGDLVEAQLTDQVKAGLAKVADGQAAGSNAIEAAANLNAAGLLKDNAKYPNIDKTAQQAQYAAQAKLEAGGEKVDGNVLIKMANADIADVAKMRSANRRDVRTYALRGDPSNAYSLPAHHDLMAWATETGKLDASVPAARIANLSPEIGFDKIDKPLEMVYTLIDAGSSKSDAVTAVASYFSLAVEYNNAKNGYKLLGLKDAGSEDFTLEGFNKKVDLTKPADIMVQISAKHLIGSLIGVYDLK